MACGCRVCARGLLRLQATRAKPVQVGSDDVLPNDTADLRSGPVVYPQRSPAEVNWGQYILTQEERQYLELQLELTSNPVHRKALDKVLDFNAGMMVVQRQLSSQDSSGDETFDD